ncbi:MAG: EAL domain-containing protein [Actinomycetota bacterium]
MLEHRLFHSPAVVLAGGLLSMAAGLALIYSGGVVSARSVVQAVSVGFFAACGATAVASWQRGVIQKRSQTLTEAADQATRDPLTGLANRAEFYRALETSLTEAHDDGSLFGVLFLDLDRFKVINDSLGHDVGDDLLKIVAERLRAATRSTDVVARLGGDEFVVIARGLASEESIVSIARQVTKRLNEPVSLNERQQHVSASIGVAIATPNETRTPDELVRDADAAMYKAKRERSGYSVFDDAQRSILTDRLDIERDLAVAVDTKQFQAWYQPIVDVHSGRLYGFEALIRWEHPDRGFISPAAFLPIAEDARLMVRIGELMLREACAQAAVWNHLCPEANELRMTVNVAEQQLTHGGFPELVAEVLSWAGLRPDQLVLEITEDVIVDHLDSLAELRELRDMGVHLAIDDFGTGQSSLAYVKQFDMVQTLKIDQSFVREMHVGSADLAIIEAIVAMATALDLSVVAEGVETDEQRKALSDLGVHLMQGYLFDKPLSVDVVGDLRAWLAKSARRASSAPGLRPLEVSRALTASNEARPS